jgi:hypothetical protein
MPDPQPPQPAPKPPSSPDRQQDETVEDSFPASDPPANTGIVGPGRTDRDRTGQKPDRG